MEGLALQEVKDSQSACTSGDHVGPGSILADVEDAENQGAVWTPKKGLSYTAGQHVETRLLSWRENSEPTRRVNKMQTIDSSIKQQNPVPICQPPKTITSLIRLQMQSSSSPILTTGW